jgi:hypothetical protein
MKIEKMQQISYVWRELLKISNSLHRLDENACNYGLTPKQEKRVEKLEEKADRLAESIGLKAYHQGDPRGCSLYLIDKTMDQSTYNRGVAIY